MPDRTYSIDDLKNQFSIQSDLLDNLDDLNGLENKNLLDIEELLGTSTTRKKSSTFEDEMNNMGLDEKIDMIN
jgi:hypothetical protein